MSILGILKLKFVLILGLANFEGYAESFPETIYESHFDSLLTRIEIYIAYSLK
jgi:hypothetical protein